MREGFRYTRRVVVADYRINSEVCRISPKMEGQIRRVIERRKAAQDKKAEARKETQERSAERLAVRTAVFSPRL